MKCPYHAAEMAICDKRGLERDLGLFGLQVGDLVCVMNK